MPQLKQEVGTAVASEGAEAGGTDQLWQVEQKQEERVRPRCCCTYPLYISSIVGSISVFKRKYIKPYLHPHIMQHVYIGCGRFMHIYASILASLCPKQTYMLIIWDVN